MGNLFADHHYIDFVGVLIPAVSTRKRCLLVVGVLIYVAFHLYRDHLAVGLVKASLPSLLFIPITLPIVDEVLNWVGGDSRWSERPLVILFATLLGCVTAEVAAPFFIKTATGGWGDAIATLFGGLVYYAFVVATKRK